MLLKTRRSNKFFHQTSRQVQWWTPGVAPTSTPHIDAVSFGEVMGGAGRRGRHLVRRVGIFVGEAGATPAEGGALWRVLEVLMHLRFGRAGRPISNCWVPSVFSR